MVVCRRSYRGKSRKGGPQTPLRCAQNAAFCKPFASAAGSRPYRRRKAGAPDGGASASAGANALSAKGGVSVYGQARPQKCEKNGFRKRTSRARRGRNASVKGLRRPPQAGTAPFLRQAARKAPAACLILFTRKVRAGRLILRGPSYAQSKKTPDGRRGSPTGRKSAGKNAQGRSGRPSGTASAGRTRRTAEIAASGGFSPRSRANRTRCRAARRTGKTDVFRPLAACPRRRIRQPPARARFYPPSAKGESQRRQSPRRPPRRPEARPPKRARGAKSRAGGPPDGPRTPAVTSDLRADRLFYSNCKGRFSSLFFSILIMLVPNPPRTARRKRQEGRFFLEDHH